MATWLDVILLIFLILLNGAFALSEIALVTSRKSKLNVLINQNVAGAKRALELSEDPTRALSTIQVGITSIGILSGIVGESVFADPLKDVLVLVGFGHESARLMAVTVVVILVTYLSIVLGELVPKRIGQNNPERLACKVAPMIYWLSVVAAIFVRALAHSTQWILLRLGFSKKRLESITEEEIHALIEEGRQSGVIETEERDLVRNVFRLDDRQLASLMTPRSDIEWLDLQDDLAVNIDKIQHSSRSRLPVCEGSLDRVIGVCTTKTLMQQLLNKIQQTSVRIEPNLKADLLPVHYVPASLTGMELLEHFRQTSSNFALVVDEYGAVEGLVTPYDVLEAIAGEFRSEYAGQKWARPHKEGGWILDGLLPIPELKDTLQLKQLPHEQDGLYNTLSGLIMLQLGRVPCVKDVVELPGWQLEVKSMAGRRVQEVHAKCVLSKSVDAK